MTPTENHNCYFDFVSNSYSDEYSDLYCELLLESFSNSYYKL